MHYFERWDAHQRARNKAKLDAMHVNTTQLEKLSAQTHLPTSQLKFVTDAWAQVRWLELVCCLTAGCGEDGSGWVGASGWGPRRGWVALQLPSRAWVLKFVLERRLSSPCHATALSGACWPTHSSAAPVLTLTQIIECRRVLSWTYTYGYYAFDPAVTAAAAAASGSGAAGTGKRGDDASSSVSAAANNMDQNKHFFEFLQVGWRGGGGAVWVGMGDMRVFFCMSHVLN